jgi:hypothetical protein
VKLLRSNDISQEDFGDGATLNTCGSKDYNGFLISIAMQPIIEVFLEFPVYGRKCLLKLFHFYALGQKYLEHHLN